MKFHAPENCPFCGAGLKGGGLGSARYTCGSHIWVREIRRPLRGDKSSRGSTIIYKLEYEQADIGESSWLLTSGR